MMFADDGSLSDMEKLFKQVKDYLGLQKKFILLEATEKLTLLFSAMIVVFISLILSLVVLFYLSFTVAYLIGPHVGGMGIAFGIIALFHILLLVLVFCLRNILIIKPITSFLAHLFLTDHTVEEDVEEE